MTLRRLFVLVSQLPPNSRTKARLGGDVDGRRWSDDTHLLADVQELLQELRIAQLASIPTTEPIELPEFHRLPRPNHGDDGHGDGEGGEPAEAAEGGAEAMAERFERIQRYLAQFDPPPAPGGAGPQQET
ncbi:hypothetical protein [Actinomadura sp. 3N508]|uniref:hypothetical protein n=1 Tax=Actinomadura sp. 3N508 TaxID=3375153 RepID=UPI0037B3E09E